MALYHYTDIYAFKSIIENKKVRLTGIAYLNDYKEAIEFIDNALKNFVNQEDIELFNGFLNCVLNSYKIYVTSFSSVSDKLSQWRGYCPSEGGVAIGFDLDHLSSTKIYGNKDKNLSVTLVKSLDESIPIGKDLFLTECFYYEGKDSEAYKLIKTISQVIIEKLKALPEKEQKVLKSDHPQLLAILNPSIISTLSATAKVLSSIKNNAFCEEKEYRIVYKTNDGNIEPLFREKQNFLIPYLELEIEPKEFIKKIIIGPSQNKELSYYSIKRFLGIHDIKIDPKVSSVPYRAF